MRGTHNFTIDTLVAIEDALDAPIIEVFHAPKVYESMMVSEPLLPPEW